MLEYTLSGFVLLSIMAFLYQTNISFHITQKHFPVGKIQFWWRSAFKTFFDLKPLNTWKWTLNANPNFLYWDNLYIVGPGRKKSGEQWRKNTF